MTNHGVEEGGGWASCVLDITARAFDAPSPGDRGARASARFADTMVEARPIDLSRAFR